MRGQTERLPLAVALSWDLPDLRTDDVATPTRKSATMPPSHKLGDVTSLLSVKVRPRLNKGLNHCHCQSAAGESEHAGECSEEEQEQALERSVAA